MSKKSSSSRKAATDFGESVDQLTQRNIECVRELEEAANQERSNSDRVADVIAKFCGSMTFVWVHMIWFGGWIIVNTIPRLPHIDPFPFTFLTLVVSLEAIFLSTFILISQNHDSKISERRNNLDLQINLLSEQENTQMLKMLQAIVKKVGAEMELSTEVEALAAQIEPKDLVNKIKEREK